LDAKRNVHRIPEPRAGIPARALDKTHEMQNSQNDNVINFLRKSHHAIDIHRFNTTTIASYQFSRHCRENPPLFIAVTGAFLINAVAIYDETNTSFKT
jgi:hypothetical protein